MYLVGAFCTSELCELRYEWRSAITWLGYVNSSINPLIYSFTNKDFKLAFKRIICCACNSPSIIIDSTGANAHAMGVSTTVGGGNHNNDDHHHYQSHYRSYAGTNDPFNLRYFSSSRTYNGIEFDATSSASCTGTFTGIAMEAQQGANATVTATSTGGVVNINNNNGQNVQAKGSNLSQIARPKSPIAPCLKGSNTLMPGSVSRDRNLNVMFEIPSPTSSSLTPEVSGVNNLASTSGSYGNISIDSSTSNSLPACNAAHAPVTASSNVITGESELPPRPPPPCHRNNLSRADSKLNGSSSVKKLTGHSTGPDSGEVIYSGQSDSTTQSKSTTQVSSSTPSSSSSSSQRPSTLPTSTTSNVTAAATSMATVSSNSMPFVKSLASVASYKKPQLHQSGSYIERCESSVSSIESFKVKDVPNDDARKLAIATVTCTTCNNICNISTLCNTCNNSLALCDRAATTGSSTVNLTSTLTSASGTLHSDRKSSRRFRMLTRQKKCANDHNSPNDSDETGASGPRSTVSLLSSQSSLISMVDKCNSPLLPTPLTRTHLPIGPSSSIDTTTADKDSVDIPSSNDSTYTGQSSSTSTATITSNTITSSTTVDAVIPHDAKDVDETFSPSQSNTQLVNQQTPTTLA